MSLSGRLEATKDASGQALVLTVIFLVVLLGFAGFAIDVGHAYLVQRQLQAGVDAAALAGAQEMPSQSQARTTAIAYGPTGGTNPVEGAEIDPVGGITFKCVRTVGCSSRRSPQNAITVSARSVVPTWFAKLVGQDSFTVNAKATACSPCSAKKFDIVIVLDRTGSMLDRNNGWTDLDNAKDGIRTFLTAMDPELDHVGLGVFPPAVGGPAPIPPDGTLASGSNPCLTPGPRRNGYDAWWPAWDGRGGNGSDSAVYTAASLSDDYLTDSSGTWALNGSSRLAALVGTSRSSAGCVQAGGTTSYANALIEAKRELMRNGRSDAQDVIVFFTDGAANTMPNDSSLESNRLPSMSPGIAEGLSQIDLGSYWNRPCSAGLAAANWARATTQIYVIGYDVLGSNGGSCGEPGVSATSTLTAMATDPSDFFQPQAGDDLSGVFNSIATDLVRPAGRLIDDTLS